MQTQIALFQPTTLESVFLRAKSPKNAFYKLWIELFNGVYTIRKESGCGNTVYDRRQWEFCDIETALKFYKRRIRDKTNPDRKSPRKYYFSKRHPGKIGKRGGQRPAGLHPP
ncbi:hypothetical protein QUF76_05995 [Desulfobacterales bacterium HSG16]|nr:hypothetical protein [Desulfobacterales bacterium HSG16]